jgi:hypothetical protein
VERDSAMMRGTGRVTDQLDCDVRHSVKAILERQMLGCKTKRMGFDGWAHNNDTTGARGPELYTERQPQNGEQNNEVHNNEHRTQSITEQ